MKKLLFFLLFFTNVLYGETRTNGLPVGFEWRYISDIRATSPRTGQFWRDAIFIDDKMIILNTYHLFALDMKGEVLWIRGLPIEHIYAEAKIHKTVSNEIVIITPNTLLRINTDDGNLIKHYNYDSRRRSAFQFTELQPRQSFLYQNNLYVFLGSDLLSFNIKTLERKKVLGFNSRPKTLPILYKDNVLLGLYNGFLNLLNLSTLKNKILIYGSTDNKFVIRQPIIQNDLIYIPTSESIMIYKDDKLYSESIIYQDVILNNIQNEIWLRSHDSDKIIKIDETLSPILQIKFNKESDKINSPLISYNDKLLNIDGITGQISIFNINSTNIALKKELYIEEFLENPPLQILDQKDQYLLLGGFDGLYLVNINKL